MSEVVYSRLRIYYVSLPWALPKESIISLVNSRGGEINTVSSQYGYRFTGAGPGADPNCEFFDCIDLWFRREGSAIPIIPLLGAVVAITVTVGVVVVFVKWFERDIVVSRAVENIYGQCVEAGGDSELCSEVVERVRSVIPSPISEIAKLLLIGIGGLLALNLLSYMRERK